MSSTLHIALHDGFERDTVVITVNGEEVYSEDNLSTDYRVGVAGAVDVDVGDRTYPIDVVVLVRTKGMSGRLTIFDPKEVWISVKGLEDRIEMSSQSEAFRYM